MKKKILLTVIAVLIIIQFIRPSRNVNAGASANNITLNYPASEDLQKIMKKACLDCHSNNTIYPWYSNVQPVGWWLQKHVNDGRKEFNFDEFLTYTPKRQHKKLDEMIEQIKEGEMPLNSYTWTHKDALLTDQEKQALINWAKAAMTDIGQKNNLPAEEEHKPAEAERD